LGYAGSCSWAPTERRWDAVRFAVVTPVKNPKQVNGRSEVHAQSRILRLTYVYELANLPAGQGQLEFDLSTMTWLSRHEDSRIQKMAECFVESYLNKRS